MTAFTQRAGFYLVFLAVALLAGSGVRAQTPDTATVRGEVEDQSHAPVADAEVTLTNILSGLTRQIHTDESGNFTVAGLPVAGQYDIAVHKQGFAEAKLSAVALAGGTTASLHLQLNVAAEKEEIVVTGAVGDVRTDEPQLGDHLSATQAEETPLLNRRITYLPLLDAANRPAINQGDVFMNEDLFTTNGTGRRQTWWEVDGSNAVDMWGRQTIFTNIPLDGVEEMTILTNPFSAEYGFSAGSVVNIVTKSGGTISTVVCWDCGGRRIHPHHFRGSQMARLPAATTLRMMRLAQTARLSFRAYRQGTAARNFSPAANTAGKTAVPRLHLPSILKSSSATIAGGWRFCGLTISSTKTTTSFSAATWTASMTPIPTELSGATASDMWTEFSSGGLIPKSWAKLRS